MAIPSITPYTGETPNKATQTKEVFADNVYATHLFYDQSFVTEMNTTIGELNTDISIINEQITFNNYKGDWLIGSTYGLGEAVSNGGFYYLSKVAGNIGHTPPTTEDAYWKKAVVVYASAGGGGTITATAGALITEGAPVSVLTDGTVVDSGELIGGLSAGTPVLFSSGTIDYISSCWDSTNQKLVIFYYDSVALASYAVVGTVTGTSISYGTPVSFLAGTASYIKAVFDPVNNKCVVAFNDSLVTNYPHVIIGTVSGTSISFGTKVQVQAVAMNMNAIIYDTVQGRVMLAYTSASLSYVIAGTVSGTSISFGTHVDLLYTSNLAVSLVHVGGSSTVAIGLLAATSLPNAKVLTLSGTTITANAGVQITAVGGESYFYSDYDSTTNKILLTYYNTGAAQSKMVVGSVSGTTTTWGTVVNNTVANKLVRAIRFNPIDSKFYLIQADTSSYSNIMPVSISGTVPTELSKIVFINTQLTILSLIRNTTNNNLVLSYADPLATSDGKASIVSDSQNFEENFIGFNTTEVASGNQATITVIGGRNNNQLGLTTGTQYYIDVSGNLTTTAGTIYAGRALSATSILVKG